MKIMWLSRHKPTKRQIKELTRLFGPTAVEWDNRPFSSADDIVERYKTSGADELVLVAPLTLFRELVRRGVRPLYATMQQVPCSSRKVEVRYKGRCYQFIDFQRVVELQLKLEPIRAKESK